MYHPPMSDDPRPRTFSIRGAGSPIVLQWQLRSPRELWRTWSAFSDTDRFNRAGRLGHRLEETVETDGTVTRSGRMRELGMQLHWVERAFDYERPTGFRAEREFLDGPARGYLLTVRLRTEGEHTQVDYRVVGFARWWWLRPLTWLIFELRVRPSLNRALQRIMESLERDHHPPIRTDAVLSAEAKQRLRTACEAMQNRAMAAHLQELLSNGADLDQARLEPMNLAARWGMAVDTVVDGCLEAVQYGILRLHCDLLCPSCHGPKQRVSKLVLDGLAPHCPSCNLYYDADLAENVVISFGSTLREVDDTPSCVGNPSATPHLLARRDLQPMEIQDFELDLEPGRYRIRRQDSLLGAELHASETGPNQVGFSLEPSGFGPEVGRVGTGKVSIWIRNVSEGPVRIAIEDATHPIPGVTLSQVLSRPETRTLFPEGFLPPAFELEVERNAVIQLERLHAHPSLVTKLQERLADSEPKWVEETPRFLRFGWTTVDAAMEAMDRIIGCPECCSSLSVGPLLRFGIRADVHHGGLALEQGRRALSISVPGGCSLTQETADDPNSINRITDRPSVTGIIPGPPIDGRRDRLIQFSATPGWCTRSVPDQPEPETLIGRTIRDRYRIGGILGAGGYGTVFAAVDETTDQDLVLKILHPKRTSDPHSVQSFFDEARSCMALESPYIVRMMDFGHTRDGLLFCVMEQLVGRSLREFPMEDRTVQRIGTICRDVGRALMVVHESKLVHRDIKPSNIFVVRDGDGTSRGRLIDFGIALHLMEGSPLEGTDRIVGSIPYISPEQVNGIPPSPAADLYGLGMVMYRSFVGQYPFEDLDPLPQLMRRSSEAVPSVRLGSRIPLPDDLVRLIDDCLDRDPAQRPGSAMEFVARLESSLRDRSARN